MAHREAEALVHGREHKLQQSYAAMESRLELLGTCRRGQRADSRVVGGWGWGCLSVCSVLGMWEVRL